MGGDLALINGLCPTTNHTGGGLPPNNVGGDLALIKGLCPTTNHTGSGLPQNNVGGDLALINGWRPTANQNKGRRPNDNKQESFFNSLSHDCVFTVGFILLAFHVKHLHL